PMCGAEIAPVEKAEFGRLLIEGGEFLRSDGPARKARPLFEIDRIERATLAAPMHGGAAIDTLALQAVVASRRPDQKIGFVRRELSVGESGVEQFLVVPAELVVRVLR